MRRSAAIILPLLLLVIFFSGKEKTHAAWFGINEATLDTNRTYNPAGTEKIGDPYPNETDNYTQTHYQLFFNQQFQQHWKASLAFFVTTGKGYFEQYKANQSVNQYGLEPYINGPDTLFNTDLIRQLWLDQSEENVHLPCYRKLA